MEKSFLNVPELSFNVPALLMLQFRTLLLDVESGPTDKISEKFESNLKVLFCVM